MSRSDYHPTLEFMAELKKLYPRFDYKENFSYLPEYEQKFLLRILNASFGEATPDVLEIGTYIGATTYVLANSGGSNHVYTVNHDGEPIHTGDEKTDTNTVAEAVLQSAGLLPEKVTMLRDFSFTSYVPLSDDGLFAFIDGSHERGHVLSDLLHVFTYAPDTVAVLDDCSPSFAPRIIHDVYVFLKAVPTDADLCFYIPTGSRLGILCPASRMRQMQQRDDIRVIGQ